MPAKKIPLKDVIRRYRALYTGAVADVLDDPDQDRLPPSSAPTTSSSGTSTPW